MPYTAPIPETAKAAVLKVDTTGTYPATTVIPDAVDIRFEKTSNNTPYQSSSTGGFVRRVPGAKDSTLSFTILAQAGVVVWTHAEGTVISACGMSNAAKGFKGYFIIDRITGEIKPGTDELVSITVECSGEGTPGVEAVA